MSLAEAERFRNLARRKPGSKNITYSPLFDVMHEIDEHLNRFSLSLWELATPCCMCAKISLTLEPP